MELYKNIYDSGDRVLFECNVKIENGKVIVYFIKSEFSNRNKWNEDDVLTDVFIKRCELANIYCQADKDGKKTIRYIKDCFKPDLRIVKEIEKISDKVDEITISLPASVCPHKKGLPTSVRAFKNSFLPLLVDINGEDASRVFQDFDVFGSKAVNVAYDALINGKEPKIENDFIEFYRIGFLRNKIFGASSTDEDALTK